MPDAVRVVHVSVALHPIAVRNAILYALYSHRKGRPGWVSEADLSH